MQGIKAWLLLKNFLRYDVCARRPPVFLPMQRRPLLVLGLYDAPALPGFAIAIFRGALIRSPLALAL